LKDESLLEVASLHLEGPFEEGLPYSSSEHRYSITAEIEPVIFGNFPFKATFHKSNFYFEA